MTDCPSQNRLLVTSLEASVENLPENLSWSIVLPALFQSLDQVRDFAGRAAQVCGLIPSDIYSVQLAVDEAFSNIIEHAYGGECEKTILCTCKIDADGLTTILRDCGQPFDPAQIPDPNIKAELQDRELGGLGLYFIHQLMDEVDFQFLPPEGSDPGCNILKMVKHKEKKA